MTERERDLILRCSIWLRGSKPCRNRARYEGHVTEGIWQPVCGRHTSGFSYVVELPR